MGIVTFAIIFQAVVGVAITTETTTSNVMTTNAGIYYGVDKKDNMGKEEKKEMRRAYRSERRSMSRTERWEIRQEIRGMKTYSDIYDHRISSEPFEGVNAEEYESGVIVGAENADSWESQKSDADKRGIDSMREYVKIDHPRATTDFINGFMHGVNNG